MTRSSWGLAALDDPRAFMAQAVCEPWNGDWFLVVHKPNSTRLSDNNLSAIALCRRCPVNTPCGQYAATHPEPHARIAAGRVWPARKEAS